MAPAQGALEYLAEVDDAVLEYLAFRGFAETSRRLAIERRKDRLRSLSSEIVADDLLDLSSTGQLRALVDLWAFVARWARFEDLDARLAEGAHRMRGGLVKLLLVRAHKAGRMETVLGVLQQAEDLGLDAADWHAWFKLPFIADPERDADLAPFFADEWASLLADSLRNFVAQVFRAKPAPKLLAFPLARKKMQALQAELKAKEFELVRLEEEVSNLREVLLNRQTSAHALEAPPAAAQGISSPLSPSSQPPPPQPPRDPGCSADEGAEGSSERSLVATAQAEHAAEVNKCRFAPDGSWLATASGDATVRLWRCGGSDGLAQDQVAFCDSAALALDWHAEKAGLLAIGTASSTVTLWDAGKGAAVGEVAVSGPAQLPFVVETKFCPRKQMLATVSVGQGNEALGDRRYGADVERRSMMCLWSATTLQQQQAFEQRGFEVNSAAFNHNGSLLVAGGSDGQVRVFDVLKGSCIMQWAAGRDARPVSRICLTQDETAIVALEEHGAVSVWSLHKLSEALCTFPAPAARGNLRQGWMSADLLSYGDLVIGQDDPNRVLVSAPCLGTRVEQLDLAKPARRACATPHARPVTSVDWVSPPSGTALVASCGLDHTVRLYEDLAPLLLPD